MWAFSAAFYLLAIIIMVYSQYSERKFLQKYRFPGVRPAKEVLSLDMEIFNMNSSQPFLAVKVTRSTDIDSYDPSNRHFALRFGHFDNFSWQLMRRKYPEPYDYELMDRSMVIVLKAPLDGYVNVFTSGKRTQLKSTDGLDAYFVDTSLNTKEMIGISNFYPFGGTNLFFGLYNNIPTKISINFRLPPGYQVVTGGSDDNEKFVSNVNWNCRLSEVNFLILRNFSELYFKDSSLRFISDQLYNQSFDQSYIPFAETANRVRLELQSHQNIIKDNNEILTVAISPFVNKRPILYGHRMCLIDGVVAALEQSSHQYYITLCITHQALYPSWKAEGAEFQYMFEGLREFVTLHLLDQIGDKLGQRLMMRFRMNILQGDEIPNSATRIGRRDLEYQSRSNIIQKTTLLLNMLSGSFESTEKFLDVIKDTLIYKTDKDRVQLMDEEIFCATLGSNGKLMNFPSNNSSVSFCECYFQWINSVGFPLITAIPKDDQLLFIVTKSKWVSGKSPFMFLFPFRYIVVTTRKTIETKTVWLMADQKEYRINLKDVAYYYANPNATGLYRINYDDTNWKNLLANSDKLDLWTRVTMIQDSHYFYQTNQLNFRIAMSCLELLRGVTEHFVWEAVDHVLVDLELQFRSTELYGWFLSFVANLVIDYYEKHDPRAPVAVRLACLAQVKACTQDAWQMLQEFITYRHVLVSREAALCSGMRVASVEYYLHVEHLVSKRDRDRNLLLIAMTCFHDQPLLERLLASTYLRNEFNLTTEFKVRLIIHMFMATPTGGDAVFKFFVVNHQRLLDDLRGNFMDTLLTTIGRSLTSRFHLRTMELALKSMGIKRPDLIARMRERRRLLETTQEELRDILLFGKEK